MYSTAHGYVVGVHVCTRVHVSEDSHMHVGVLTYVLASRHRSLAQALAFFPLLTPFNLLVSGTYRNHKQELSFSGSKAVQTVRLLSDWEG